MAAKYKVRLIKRSNQTFHRRSPRNPPRNAIHALAIPVKFYWGFYRKVRHLQGKVQAPHEHLAQMCSDTAEERAVIIRSGNSYAQLKDEQHDNFTFHERGILT